MKYMVHFFAPGNVRSCAPFNSINAASADLRVVAERAEYDGYGLLEDGQPTVWADVYTHDKRDYAGAAHGEMVARLTVGPRGGVKVVRP
jgi:hypothetical protein